MKKIVFGLVLLLAILIVWVSVASAGTTYLPLVSNAIPPTATLTPTPTSTPTPTPTALPGPVLLPNGDFEQGHAVWHEYSNHGYDIITYKSSLPVPPKDGSWAAWLGGASNDADTLDQTVYISADRPYLSVWMYISSTDFCGYDVVYIFVNNNLVGQNWLCSENNTYGWVQKVYDLHSLVGQNITIMIYVGTDLTRLSSLYLDRFMFQSSSVAADPVPVNLSEANANAMKSEFLK
jgi:hypothetical protein